MDYTPPPSSPLFVNKDKIEYIKEPMQDKSHDIYMGLMNNIKPSNSINQHFDWNSITMSEKQKKYIEVICDPVFRGKYYDYMETYHPIIDDNGTQDNTNDDKIIDHAACAPFATAAAHAFCNADGMTLPLSVPGSTWELVKKFSTIPNNYRVESHNLFDINYRKNLPNGSIVTAQYNASRYKEKGATHSLLKTEDGLIHLFHEDLVFSSWANILPYKDQQNQIIPDKFILNTGKKKDNKIRYESFTLVPGSSVIYPVYTNHKEKIKPRYEYTVESSMSMSLRRFAELVGQSLTIPQAAAATIIRQQNSTLCTQEKGLASISNKRTVKILGGSNYSIHHNLKVTQGDQVPYDPQ